jgi:G8 domain
VRISAPIAFWVLATLFGVSASAEQTHPMAVDGSCVPEKQLSAQTVNSAHQATLNLVPICSETHVAVKSGKWSDPSTWARSNPPGSEARVGIPSGLAVEVDKDIADAVDWIRVDGSLTWSADRSTSLVARTIVVTHEGHLQIGTEDRPVSSSVVAQLTFAARTDRNREQDPFDMAGGLISMGDVQIHGAQKTSWKVPVTGLKPGTETVRFEPSFTGWSVGDELLLAGTSDTTNEDERRNIVKIDAGTVTLDKPLQYAHLAPDGTSIPVGNLTRNVRLRSLAATPLSARGHIMFMHRQTGIVIEGAEFRDLGRTDARQAHTVPELDKAGRLVPGSDDNTIGRYAIHFHLVSGARLDLPPNVVRDCVVWGSPKHGIVNHGGHVLAEDNVTFEIAGSHFFSENGTEIGSFRGNLAVRSAGSGDEIMSRSAIFDNGHQGHGFWMQSAGVRVTDNWAFGHAGGAYVVFGYAFSEANGRTYFDAHNTDNVANADEKGRIPTADVDLYFARNRAAGSANGVEIWNHKLLASHPSQSLIEDVTVWNVSSHALFIPYVRDLTVRDFDAYGSGTHPQTDFAIGGNSQTENITFQNISVRKYAIGLLLPQRGINTVDGAFLRNGTNVVIESADRPGRLITLNNIDVPSGGTALNFNLKDQVVPENGDLAMLFESDRIFWSDSGRTVRLYSKSQDGSDIAFADNGPAELRGLTSREIQSRFRFSFGGQLAPANAKPLPNSTAMMSDIADNDNIAPTQKELEFAGNPSEELYPLAGQHIVNAEDDAREARWNIEGASTDEHPAFFFLKKTHPKLIVHPMLRTLEIHPDDVPYGYRLSGVVVDIVDRHVTQMAFIQDFHDLRPDEQGRIALDVKFPDPSGQMTSLPLSLTVTDRIRRRGRNLNFFEQAKYCGKCQFPEEMRNDIHAMFPDADTVN